LETAIHAEANFSFLICFAVLRTYLSNNSSASLTVRTSLPLICKRMRPLSNCVGPSVVCHPKALQG
jgi:hypothetical protein